MTPPGFRIAFEQGFRLGVEEEELQIVLFLAQHGKLLTNGTLPYDFIVKNALPNVQKL